MKKFMRNLQPEQQFILLRTGEKYKFVRRDHSTPKGTRYVVLKDGEQAESSLHHACHVWVQDAP